MSARLYDLEQRIRHSAGVQVRRHERVYTASGHSERQMDTRAVLAQEAAERERARKQAAAAPEVPPKKRRRTRRPANGGLPYPGSLRERVAHFLTERPFEEDFSFSEIADALNAAHGSLSPVLVQMQRLGEVERCGLPRDFRYGAGPRLRKP